MDRQPQIVGQRRGQVSRVGTGRRQHGQAREPRPGVVQAVQRGIQIGGVVEDAGDLTDVLGAELVQALKGYIEKPFSMLV